MRKIPDTPRNFRGTYVNVKHPKLFKKLEPSGANINPFTTT